MAEGVERHRRADPHLGPSVPSLGLELDLEAVELMPVADHLVEADLLRAAGDDGEEAACLDLAEPGGVGDQDQLRLCPVRVVDQPRQARRVDHARLADDQDRAGTKWCEADRRQPFDPGQSNFKLLESTLSAGSVLISVLPQNSISAATQDEPGVSVG